MQNYKNVCPLESSRRFFYTTFCLFNYADRIEEYNAVLLYEEQIKKLCDSTCEKWTILEPMFRIRMQYNGLHLDPDPKSEKFNKNNF